VNPEERLDRLLERYDGATDATSAREAAQIDAAQAVRALRAIPVPADFAARLEARVRERASALATPDTIGQPQRRAGQPQGIAPTEPSAPPSLSKMGGGGARRAVLAGGGALAALVLLAGVLFAASANSVPGDWLYGIKQFRNQIALAQAATPTDRAEVLIQQLRGAVSDLRAEIGSGHVDADIEQALGIVAADTRAAQAAVAALPSGAGRTQAAQDLAGALAYEQATLHHLVTQVDWPVRLAISAQLGMLGIPVPAITAVSIIEQGNGDARVTIRGSDFAAGAQVWLDGTPAGTLLSVTPTRIIVRFSAVLLTGPHQLGVQNPDGTAASSVISGGISNGQGAPLATATPGAQSTPGNGRGHRDPTPSPKGTPVSGTGRRTPTPSTGSGIGTGNGTNHPTPTRGRNNGGGR
jgi:hypothetical protein